MNKFSLSCQECCCPCPTLPTRLCLTIPGTALCPVTVATLSLNTLTNSHEGIIEAVVMVQAGPPDLYVNGRWIVRLKCIGTAYYLQIAGWTGCNPSWAAFDATVPLPAYLLVPVTVTSCRPFVSTFTNLIPKYASFLGAVAGTNGTLNENSCLVNERFLGLETYRCDGVLRAPWSFSTGPISTTKTGHFMSEPVGGIDPYAPATGGTYWDDYGPNSDLATDGYLYKRANTCTYHKSHFDVADSFGTSPRYVYDLTYHGAYWELTYTDLNSAATVSWRAPSSTFMCSPTTDPNDPSGVPYAAPLAVKMYYYSSTPPAAFVYQIFNPFPTTYFVVTAATTADYITVIPYNGRLFLAACGVNTALNPCVRSRTEPYNPTLTIQGGGVLDGASIPLAVSRDQLHWVGQTILPTFTDPGFGTCSIIVRVTVPMDMSAISISVQCPAIGYPSLLEYDLSGQTIVYSCPPDPLVITQGGMKVRLAASYIAQLGSSCCSDAYGGALADPTAWINMTLHVS